MDGLVAARDAWLAGRPEDRAVAGPEAVATCAEAIRVLADRLLSLGLPVADPIEACADLDAGVARLEAVGPAVPPALHALWVHLGRVALVDLDGYAHVGFWEGHGVRFRREPSEVRVEVTDGVVIDGPGGAGWIEHALEELAIQEEEGWPVGHVLSPDGYHKDDISGGAPYVLLADVDPWLSRMAEFRWCGLARPRSAPAGDRPDLVSYLRSSVLECGGFPGLLGDPAFERIRPALVDGLPAF